MRRRLLRAFTIQYFSTPAPNIPTGFGEGEAFLGEMTVTTRLVPDPNSPPTLLPTDTSEFSAARRVE